MPDIVRDFLRQHGPSRSSKLAEAIQAEGFSAEAARQRLSRARPPVRKFPLRLLPKKEAFFYLEDQRNTDVFWANFLRDMRETGSVFALAIDGLLARGGTIPYEMFPTISGAPAQPMKGQLNADHVRETLMKATFIDELYDADGTRYLRFKGGAPYYPPRRTVELVLLDAVREWARKLGLASYNSIAIRGEEALRPIGPFLFDLAGPSYFAPVQQAGGKPGFIVADVLAEGTLNEHHIQYFIRKVTMLRSMRPSYAVLPFLVAESFTSAALKAGHAAGLSLATPTTLFGRRVGAAIMSLVETLKNVAAYASSESPERITRLISDLSEIEGRADNLRGVLFELLCAYLARRDAVSIDMGVIARDPETGSPVDIDIFKVTNQMSSVTCIECKGKEPGGKLTLDDAQTWLRKAAIMRAHLSSHPHYREAEHRFELWTSGTFEADALYFLEAEKLKRTRAPIDWKDGDAVQALATGGKEKAMTDAFRQHFLNHPLADVAHAVQHANTASPLVPVSDVLNRMAPGAYGSPLGGYLPKPKNLF